MTELIAATSTAMSQLQSALKANAIQVPDDGAVQRLLDQQEWIYHIVRVQNMLKKINKDQLYSVFNSEHHLQAASRLFEFLQRRDEGSCVVYGHKAQGKTQFLFFVFKLLQAMGEKVLFLDRTILPFGPKNQIRIRSDKFCGHLWKDKFLQIDGNVTASLHNFYQDPQAASLEDFFTALCEYTESTSDRVWIIIDEVVLFENFPLRLPEEQDLGPFNWIVTGSAGIGSWVSKRHLQNVVFDLPLFTKEECLDFAQKFCTSLNMNLETVFDGVPSAGVDDWLEEQFGGVVGYIAELILHSKENKLVSEYMSSLDDRVRAIITNAAERRHISNMALATDWLNEIKSSSNRWTCFCDAGLCGGAPPRGVIFTFILKWLCTFSPEEDSLPLVVMFRSRFKGDPGLDGCLLELEGILKLRAKKSIEASLLTKNDQGWIVQESMELPPRGTPLNFWAYDESNSALAALEKSMNSSSSPWNLIQVPSGFNVIDVALVVVSGSPAIYGMQITRSVKPFAEHHTFDTCSQKSQARLDKFWSVISDHFKLNGVYRLFYVMLAPNCEGDQFKPPAGHASDYYFAPTSIVADAVNPKKARPSKIIAPRQSREKKQKNQNTFQLTSCLVTPHSRVKKTHRDSPKATKLVV
jgi:hypothetical protein